MHSTTSGTPADDGINRFDAASESDQRSTTSECNENSTVNESGGASAATATGINWGQFFKRLLLTTLLFIVIAVIVTAIVIIALYVPPTAFAAPIVATALAQIPISAVVALITNFGVNTLFSLLKRLFFNALPGISRRWFFETIRNKREGTADSWIGWRYFGSLFSHLLREKEGPLQKNILMVAIEVKGGTSMLEFFTGREADLAFECDKEGNTALHYAVKHHYRRAIEIIATCPTPMEKCTDASDTQSIVGSFADQAMPGAVNNDGDTALILSIKRKTPNTIFSTLIKVFDFDDLGVDIQDVTGNTALMYAVIRGNEKMISVLCGVGELDGQTYKKCTKTLTPANPLIRNNQGQTALDIAYTEFDKSEPGSSKELRLRGIIDFLKDAENIYSKRSLSADALRQERTPAYLYSKTSRAANDYKVLPSSSQSSLLEVSMRPRSTSALSRAATI